MKTISNFHTHTYLCKHAVGSPKEYALQAQKEGCSVLGFTDHCPYPQNMPDYWPEIRMSTEEVPLYKSMIQKAKEAVPFPIYMGFECEWDSRFKSWYSDELLGTYGADYIILGSHWVTTQGGNRHVYAPNIDNNSDLNHYIDQTIDGMRSGLFAFLAHPDLFMISHPEWDQQTKSCSLALIDAAKDLNLPMEINGLGLSREPNSTSRGIRYQYPYVEFWELVAEKKLTVVCNSDAHKPEHVRFNAWKARDFAGRFGLTPLENLDVLPK